MNGKKISTAILLIGIGILSVFQLWGLSLIPFHPDESTQLYMSADFERFFFMTPSLYWNPEKDNLAQQYRLIQAPLTKYILGIGRNIAGLPPLEDGWDRNKTLEENEEAGAIPSYNLLISGRLAISLLLPLSMLIIYLAGGALEGSTTGVLGAFLLGSNALILLHGRTAMAEGALTFGIVLAIWGFLQGDKRPWLAGMGIAIAYSANHTTLALFPAGFLAVLWFRPRLYKDARRLITNGMIYIGVFLLATLAINPFLWSDPIGAITASWNARLELSNNQVTTTETVVAQLDPNQPSQRAAAVLLDLYVRDPSFAGIDNDPQEVIAFKNNYLAINGHNLGRGLLSGTFVYSLTLFGIALGLIGIFKRPGKPRRSQTILLVATTGMVLYLLLFIPFPQQRHVIPLVPLTSLWIAYGLSQFLYQFSPRISYKEKRTHISAPAPYSSSD